MDQLIVNVGVQMCSWFSFWTSSPISSGQAASFRYQSMGEFMSNDSCEKSTAVIMASPHLIVAPIRVSQTKLGSEREGDEQCNDEQL